MLTIQHNSLLQLKKSFIKVISFPNICNLKSKPSCHTLSNALDISRKASLTSGPSSNPERISCASDSKWLVQESPGLNPEYFGNIKFFSGKYEKMLL